MLSGIEELRPRTTDVVVDGETRKIESLYSKMDEILEVSLDEFLYLGQEFRTSGSITYMMDDTYSARISLAQLSDEKVRKQAPILVLMNGEVWSPVAYIFPADQDRPFTLVSGNRANAPSDIKELAEIVHNLYEGQGEVADTATLTETINGLKQQITALERENRWLKSELLAETDPHAYVTFYGDAEYRFRSRLRRQELIDRRNHPRR